VTFIQFRNDI